jgi:hypothetical protein
MEFGKKNCKNEIIQRITKKSLNNNSNGHLLIAVEKTKIKFFILNRLPKLVDSNKIIKV